MNELCENCERERNLEIQYPGVCDTCGNIVTSKQPERSKREDFDSKILDRALKRAHSCGAWEQEDYDEMFRLVQSQRCGALNSMET